MILFTVSSCVRLISSCVRKSRALYVLLLAFSLLQGQQLFSQNYLDKTGLSSASPAYCAYSMRLLSSTYAGSAIRVRRSSDNATSDIGFTAGGDLNAAALEAFIGSGNGYIVTWYDQSGNGRDLTQATSSNQPRIAQAGVVDLENNLPFIRFFGVAGGSPYNALFLPAAMTTVGHVSAVMRVSAGGNGFILSSSGTIFWHSDPGSRLITSVYASASILNGSAWVNGEAMAPVDMPWPLDLTVAEIQPDNPSSQTTWNNIGTDRGTAHNINNGGGYSELIVFSAALSESERQAMETNQVVYYSIPSILPVVWSHFQAQSNSTGVLLQWQTASEQNTARFIVQRSADGTKWKDIAEVTAAGHSDAPRTYEYVDENAVTGNNFYRVMLIDLDAKKTYSSVEVVNYRPTGVVKVMSTLVSDGVLRLRLSTPADVSFYSAGGTLLWKKHVAAGMQRLPVHSYAAGIYFLRAGKVVEKVMLK